ncbi:DUF2937 family protein [Paracoccus salsus]|uniref:DUF2937 family protein n=1 Tax=Paracoccus salsus TaxID=2911061 RepID=UPI001F288756|nr:DUF2937 family protein [Paracoccus salsus]MCF3974055.1 DUF2937 family protein [Paracoccus salsus]
MSVLLRLASAALLATLLSQFPAFSDQYVQRLGGQVDALERIAADFDTSAEKAGLSRDEALRDLAGSRFRDAHQADLRRAFRRLQRAQQDLTMLRRAGPVERMLLPHRLRDPQTLAATWGDFRPAIPVTVAGLAGAAVGFGLGWLVAALPGLFFRRRSEPRAWR